MAANFTRNQVETNGLITTEHGHSMIGSSFGDNNHFEYYNMQISSSQYVQAKVPFKYCFYGVPAENHDFVDRPGILARMEAALTSPSKGCRILALKGLGGMGKTQLMLQYCYLHRAAYEFVFWLEVDSWSTAITSFRNLAINLGLDEESTKGKDSENRTVDWVCSWFQIKTKWLLLLNNADDTMSTDVFKLLPRIGGDIIITTREPIPSRLAVVIPVHKMLEEEALLLLFGTSSMGLIEQERSKLHYAREIINELDYMPLAIDLARAHLENTMTSFREYLSMFKDMNERAGLLGYSNKDNLSQYKHTVATVWQLSLERIRAENPISLQILQICTFLQPENIPVSLFKNQYSTLELVLPFSGSSTSEEDTKQAWKAVREAVAVLVKFSFVTRTCPEAEDGEENPANDVLTIHRLVQKVVYNTMNGDQRLRYAYNFATALNKDTQYDDDAEYAPPTRKIMDTYLPHIRYFVTLLDDLSQNPLVSEDLYFLLYRTIWYLLRHGTYFGIDEVVQFFTRVSGAVYAEDYLPIGRLLIIHASLYYHQGKYDEAEPLFKQALAVYEKVLGSEHPDTTMSLTNLAMLYIDQGKYDEAEPLYRRALAVREKALGPEHPGTAYSLNSLATLHCIRGKYGEAEPLFKQVLAIREKVLGSEHPITALSLYNLAILYHNQGKYGEAEPLYKRALAIWEKVLGSEHPDTAMSLHTLAILYKDQGKYNEAEPLYRRALAVREKALGPEHPVTARSLGALAELFVQRSKYEDAKPLYKRALVIQEKALDSMHPHTASLVNDLGDLYKSQGKLYEAEALYQRALNIRKEILGPTHPATASSVSSLGDLYVLQAKYDAAEPLCKLALAIREERLGPMHPDTATSVNIMGDLFRGQGNYVDAKVLMQRALAIRQQVLGPIHPDTAMTAKNLEDLHKMQAQRKNPRRFSLEEALGSLNLDTATSLKKLGAFFRK